MMKVCHLTSAHESNDTRIFYKECTSLANNGYDTYLIARGGCREENGVHVLGMGDAPSNRIIRMLFFARKVYKRAVEIDCEIYHVHDPELLPYALKLKRSGKVVIFDSHENTLEQMVEKQWIPSIVRPLVASLYRKYATSAFKKLDALITVTPHIVDQLKTINPNTWMVTNYPIVIENKVASTNLGNLKLCFTGGIDVLWNHKEIIDSLADIDGVEYELCGAARSEYLNILKDSEGWKKVNYYGRIPFEASLEIQRNSSVGMAIPSPSRNSGWNRGTLGNTKLFEYMMAGLPVICTGFSLWKEIVEKWRCGICIPANDQCALKEAIIYMKDNREKALEMGKNGRKAAEQEYNWNTQEKELVMMYKEMETSYEKSSIN